MKGIGDEMGWAGGRRRNGTDRARALGGAELKKRLWSLS